MRHLLGPQQLGRGWKVQLVDPLGGGLRYVFDLLVLLGVLALLLAGAVALLLRLVLIGGGPGLLGGAALLDALADDVHVRVLMQGQRRWRAQAHRRVLVRRILLGEAEAGHLVAGVVPVASSSSSADKRSRPTSGGLEGLAGLVPRCG